MSKFKWSGVPKASYKISALSALNKFYFWHFFSETVIFSGSHLGYWTGTIWTICVSLLTGGSSRNPFSICPVALEEKVSKSMYGISMTDSERSKQLPMSNLCSDELKIINWHLPMQTVNDRVWNTKIYTLRPI